MKSTHQAYPPKSRYKNVYKRTIEMLQHAHIFKVNFYFKAHNAHFKLALLILG